MDRVRKEWEGTFGVLVSQTLAAHLEHLAKSPTPSGVGLSLRVNVAVQCRLTGTTYISRIHAANIVTSLGTLSVFFTPTVAVPDVVSTSKLNTISGAPS